jgi:RNA polymerase sigma factor (sigma-70 family)
MSQGDLSSLLVRLNEGDASAAEQVFIRFEPYLKLIVSRQMSGAIQSKFNSSDIVQSIWADLLHGFRDGKWQFSDARHLQAFLTKVTKNRFLDRVRQQKSSLQLEEPLNWVDSNVAIQDPGPRPSQEVRAIELWGEISKTCNQHQRQVLELKRQGKSLQEIATETGLHASSVRRILYDLARIFVDGRNGRDHRSGNGVDSNNSSLPCDGKERGQ